MEIQCKEHAVTLKETLRDHGLKATPPRLAILDILTHAKKPLSIKNMQDKLKDFIDTATLYRTFETFRSLSLVEEVDFKHGHAHYELSAKEHHHHAICENCGKVVDISACDIADLERQVKKISNFKKINSHSLEFFGLCEKCAKN